MNIQTVLREFASQGLNSGSMVTENQINDIMNRLVQKNSHQQMGMFSPTVAAEIWEQCNLDDNGMANVGEYSQVLIDAKQILEGRVREVSQKLQSLKSQRQHHERQSVNFRASGNQAGLNGLRNRLAELDQQIRECELDQQDYNEDFRAIIMPFIDDPNISRQSMARQNLSRQNISVNNRSLLNPNNPNTSVYAPDVINNSFRGHSQIFMKRSNTALTMIFYLGLLVLALELFITIHKYHFVTLLTAIAVLAIFGLNYFDKSYIKLVLGMLIISVLLEIFWILSYMGQYASPGPFSENSTIHSAWLRFTLFLVVVNTVMKVIIFLILMAYRNIQETEAITVFGYSITLSGQCTPLRSWEFR